MWIHCNKGRLARGGGSLGIRGDKSGPRFHFWVADTKTKMGGGGGGGLPPPGGAGSCRDVSRVPRGRGDRDGCCQVGVGEKGVVLRTDSWDCPGKGDRGPGKEGTLDSVADLLDMSKERKD